MDRAIGLLAIDRSEDTMYGTLIVGYDGSDQADDGLALGARLARFTGARLILAFAYGGGSIHVGIGSASIGVTMRREAKEVLERGLRLLPPGIDAKICPMRESSAPRALHELAVVEDADLVVLGSTALGRVGRVMTGSTATPLLYGLPCALAVAPKDFRRRGERRTRKVGICWNESPEAALALETAVELAGMGQAELRLLHAVDPTGYLYAGYPGVYVPDERSIAAEAEDKLAEVVAGLSGSVAASAKAVVGRPGVALARQAADDDVDLLVTGSRGYGPVRRVLLGGVAAKLMRTAPCPLLIVPRSAFDHYHDHDEEISDSTLSTV